MQHSVTDMTFCAVCQLWRLKIEEHSIYLRQRPCFVRANDRDRTQGLDGLQRFTQNSILAHEVCRDSQAGGKGYWKTFRNECDSDTDTVDNQCRDTNPVRIAFT